MKELLEFIEEKINTFVDIKNSLILKRERLDFDYEAAEPNYALQCYVDSFKDYIQLQISVLFDFISVLLVVKEKLLKKGEKECNY